jgi:hypothetical protein
MSSHTNPTIHPSPSHIHNFDPDVHDAERLRLLDRVNNHVSVVKRQTWAMLWVMDTEMLAEILDNTMPKYLPGLLEGITVENFGGTCKLILSISV